MPAATDPNLLVGIDTRDDAAVYRLDDATAVVCTNDFFTPMLDDPFDFGRVAAANALSDIYAMGGRPLMALNIVGFPARDLPLEILHRILAGGQSVAAEARIPIAGGHSIDDKEPKYGLAVVGLVAPDRVLRNVGALPGDRLLLTKPLGSGVVTTAIKRGLASAEEIAELTEMMATLNRSACEVFAAQHQSVHALTDVTGYGLLGHLHEMVSASAVGARLVAANVPVLQSARRYASEDVVPDGTRANLEAAMPHLAGQSAMDRSTLLLLADAQTSGGLLAAVADGAAAGFEKALLAAGVAAVAEIGEITAVEPGSPTVTIV